MFTNEIFSTCKQNGSHLKLLNNLNTSVNSNKLNPYFQIVVSVHVAFHQAIDPSFLTEPPPVFNSEAMEVFEAEDINTILGEIYSYLLALIDEFQERGSGWVLNQLLRLDLHTYQYTPLRGSTFIILPPEVQAKKAIVNIQNRVSLFIYKKPC